MATTIRVGVIGAGANTQKHHIPKLQAQDGVEVVAVCNRSATSSEAAAARFGIPHIGTNWRELVEDPEIDAVVIGTWPNMHARITIAALAAGKHVMTEARMARDAREARAMLAAAHDRPDLVKQVVPAPFSLEVDRTVHRLLAEGYIGPCRVIEHTAAAPVPIDPHAALHWRQDRDLSGLNVAMLGIVYEMILRWVGEAATVMAMSRTWVQNRLDAEGRMRAVGVPDHVDVLAEMVGGAQLHIQQSTATVYKRGGGTWLYGDEGVLRFHDGGLFGARIGDPDLAPIPIPAAEKGGWRVEEEFIGAIRGNEPITYTPFEDGVKYMEFVEAVARSAATGRRIILPLRLNE